MIAKDLALLSATVARAKLLPPRASAPDGRSSVRKSHAPVFEKLICLLCFVFVFLHVESPAFHFLC